MKMLLFTFLLGAMSTSAAEVFPIKAGDGNEITSPIDTSTVDIKVGDKTLKVPKGMVYVPAGNFTFGTSETRDLRAYFIGRFSHCDGNPT